MFDVIDCSPICYQIEALKEVGVTEVVLAINYQPEVKFRISCLVHILLL